MYVQIRYLFKDSVLPNLLIVPNKKNSSGKRTCFTVLSFSSEKEVFNGSSDSAYNFAKIIELDHSYLIQIYIWEKIFEGLDQAHTYYC